MFISVPEQMELKCMLNDYINNEKKRVDDVYIVQIFREIINIFFIHIVHACFPLLACNIYDIRAHIMRGFPARVFFFFLYNIHLFFTPRRFYLLILIFIR